MIEPARICMTSRGLGDALLCLCVVEGLRKHYRGVRFVYGVPEDSYQWIRLFGEPDLEHGYKFAVQPKVLFPYNSYPRELEEQSILPRWVYYLSELGPWQALPALPVAKLPAADLLWAEQFRGAVVLFPCSAHSTRSWLPNNWRALEDELTAQGKRVLLLDGNAKNVSFFTSEKVCGEPASRVAALVSVASVVVCNDSGSGHLAGCLGTKTVVLCGPTSGPKLFGLYPTVRTVRGVLPCSGCYWRGPNHCTTCNTVCADLQSIRVADVLGAISL